MKLLFPNGEHGPVELKDGVTRVGSGAGVEVAVIAPGIAAQHCEIELRDGAAKLRVKEAHNPVLVNGKTVTGETPIKSGDLILFAKVGARVMASERVGVAAPAASKSADSDDDGRTKIRMALPRFVLRGVSGSTFGKTFPLFGTITVGRHSDCNISIPGEEISRHHAKLQVLPDGVSVEDLGSANGTYINGKRIHQGMLKPGEELRLDTLRFLLVAPGFDAAAAAKPKPKAAPAPPPPTPVAARGGSAWIWIVLAIVVAGAVGAGLYFGGFL